MQTRPGPAGAVTRSDRRRRLVQRLVLGTILTTLAVLSVVLILREPATLGVTAILILLLSLSIAGLTHLFVPLELGPKTKRSITVGAGIIPILAALLAIPTLTGRPLQTPSIHPSIPSVASDQPDNEKELLSATVVRGPVGDVPNCDAYALPKGSSSSVTKPSAATPEAEREWIRNAGAVNVDTTPLEIRLQGLSEKTVVLSELRVVIDAVEAPTDKDTYFVTFGCGGGFSPRLFQIDLEDSDPVPTPMPGEDAQGKRVKPQAFPLKVNVSDPETLIVYSSTKSKDITWHLEIPWYSAGQEGTLVIRDSTGSSFKTLSQKRTVTSYYFDGERKDWQRWCSPQGPVSC